MQFSSLTICLFYYLTFPLFSLYYPQSTHKASIGDFWRTSHHDGKISILTILPFTIMYKVAVYAPAESADTLTLFPLSPSILLDNTYIPGRGQCRAEGCSCPGSRGQSSVTRSWPPGSLGESSVCLLYTWEGSV